MISPARRRPAWRGLLGRSRSFVLVLALALGLLAAVATPVLAASPGPSPAASPPIIGTGDPRSDGQGPGLVGSPFAIAIGVVLLGAIAAGGTLVFLRVTRDD
ncbi:MAG: hypothetical protein QOH61_1547 [Chloroflexota bacterium]|nr:hypothetical protein [Chloroflexota bacterium]